MSITKEQIQEKHESIMKQYDVLGNAALSAASKGDVNEFKSLLDKILTVHSDAIAENQKLLANIKF